MPESISPKSQIEEVRFTLQNLIIYGERGVSIDKRDYKLPGGKCVTVVFIPPSGGQSTIYRIKSWKPGGNTVEETSFSWYGPQDRVTVDALVYNYGNEKLDISPSPNKNYELTRGTVDLEGILKLLNEAHKKALIQDTILLSLRNVKN